MKKLEIKTEKATLLVVDFSLDRGKTMAEALLCNPNFGDKEFEGFELLGKVSEITEEEWSNVIEEDFDWISKEYSSFYKDSKGDIISLHGKNPKESGLSLLKANGVLLENKYKDDWDELCTWGHGDFSKDGKSSFDLYTEEQQKVWTNPHVFIKVE